MVSATVQQIAQQNDQFRRGDPNVFGQRFMTAEIIELLKWHKVDGDRFIWAVVGKFGIS